MSRRLVRTSTQYLYRTDAVVSTPPLTMACWFRTYFNTDTQYLMCLATSSGTTSMWHALMLRGPSYSYPVVARTINGSTDCVANTTTQYYLNTWHHACAVFASSSARYAYIDGGSQGANTTACTNPTVARTAIGALYRSTAEYTADADIAEAAIWNAALTGDEIASLARGVSPLNIRPDNLVCYWPLVGRYDPEIDVVSGKNLTLANSPTSSDHPRIFYFPHIPVSIAPGSASSGTRLVTVSDSGVGVDNLSEQVIFADDSGTATEDYSLSAEITVTDDGTAHETAHVLFGGQGQDHETKKHPQRARMYLAVKRPRIIWKGVVAASRGTYGTDGEADTDFEIHVSSGGNVSGFDVNNFLPDLTAWVGTTDGGAEHGRCRVRRIDGTTLYVSADLSCNWQAGDYVSITDVHEYWPKPHYVSTSGDTILVLKDHDLDAETHKAQYPVVNFGPPACAFRDDVTKQATVHFDATRSYLVQPDSLTYEEAGWERQGISNYEWWFEGGSPETSTEPVVDVTYSTPGQYIARCTCTGINGKTYTGYRNVFIFDHEGEDAPITEFTSPSITGDINRHGWEARLEVFGAAADPAVLPNGAQAVLFAEEWFADAPKTSSYGHPGRENILMVGWIHDSTITITAEGARAEMTIRGLHELIQEKANYAVYFTQIDPNAPLWSYFPTDPDPQPGEDYGLTVRKAWYHLLAWHWTILRFTDVYLPDDHNNYLPGQSFPDGSLGSQLDAFCRDTQAQWGVSRQGALWIFSWPNTLAFRWRYDKHPTILELTSDDFESIEIRPRITPKASLVRVEGIMANATGWADPVVASVPGNSKAYMGHPLTIANQVLGHPDQAVELASMVLAEESRKIEEVRLSMCGNFSLCDVAPCSRLLLTFYDSTRGIAWNQRPFFVIGAEDAFDAENGVITTSLTLLPEVYPYGYPAYTKWAQDLYNEAEQEAPTKGTYAVAGTLQELSTPSTYVVPATMGDGNGSVNAGVQGLTYVRLYDDPAQVVQAENREYKEIPDRECWVEISSGTNTSGRGGQPTYRVVGIRAAPFVNPSSEGVGYVTRIAVFRVPGDLSVEDDVAGVLTVLGSPLYARRIKATVKEPPEGGPVTVEVEGVGTVSIGDGATSGTTTLSSEVLLLEPTELRVNILAVGTDSPGTDLTVEVECREYGL